MNKLQKLINHEKSAREIGSTAEADAYKRAIDALKNKLKVSGKYQCSCGFLIEFDFDCGELGLILADNLLRPHQLSGHQLTEVK